MNISPNSQSPPLGSERMVGISVSMPISMLLEADKLAAAMQMSRSEFLRHAIKQAALAHASSVREEPVVPLVSEPVLTGSPPDACGAEGAGPQGA